MDLSAHNYGTSMLDMELTSSEHRGIMMLESEESAEARAPRAPRGCHAAHGAQWARRGR